MPNNIKDRLRAKIAAKFSKQPANEEEAKQMFPNHPLCVGAITIGSTMTVCTSFDGNFTSLGWIF